MKHHSLRLYIVLSDKIDGIAIVVVSNEKYLAKAVGLAVKMKNAL